MEQLDDLELVEVVDEDLNSMMVLQHKSTVETLRRRVQELEVGQEEVQQSCAVAVEELTARQEECKVKEARVAELEGKLTELQREYQQLEVGTNCLFPHPACWC